MIIKFENTRKSYGGDAAIADFNLEIQKGELLVLLGPSGSGKSTVLKMVNRMVNHDEGQIFFHDQEINRYNLQDLRRRMGYAIQSVGLFPHRTVAQNIATVPKLLGWDTQSVQARVNELLTLLAMDPKQYAARYPHQLSGGQQQRIGVARALAADPDVLLMDEPFGALDPVTRSSLQVTLKQIQQSTGKTILFVTHDIDEALLLATRIVLLNQGRIVQVGTPLQLLQQPAGCCSN
jgi:osmoprotectant transport system ATP-binding protein